MRTQTQGAAIEAPSHLYDFARMRVHFIGIGGSGMSGAAALLLNIGADVSGSDAVPFDGMGTLVKGGARVSIGHRADNVGPGVNVVVASAAVPESNPELAAGPASADGSST